MAIWYDDENGTPVNITALCLTVNDIDVKGMIENITPFGVAMKVFIPTGRGEFLPIVIGGLFRIGNNTFNDLFADRVPEDTDTPTRTFTMDWTGEGGEGGTGGEYTSVETYLSDYKRQPNNDNGLTRAQIELQPTGEITEGHAS
jgi:hypothetical protein